MIGLEIEPEKNKNELISSELRLQHQFGLPSAIIDQVIPARIVSEPAEITDASPTKINSHSSNVSRDSEPTFHRQDQLAVQLELSENRSTKLQPYHRSKRGIRKRQVWYPFPTKDSAKYHHTKHNSDYGQCSFGTYCGLAAQMRDKPTPYMYTRPNGDKVKYFPATNDFLVMNRNNQVKTFYKPTGGMFYFTRDKQKHTG